ncbi:DUF3352 domain-containing protein [Vulcanococcus sp.]|jgi:hypothetical protein|uniref:DUF3352 domain-containing protein n=1 Tax=Vulcanococcus sp. TaxID=2856995 RepID=UPI0037D9AF8E
MRARPFLVAVLAVAAALLSAALAGWWLLWNHSPLALQTQRLELPLAARFVPRTAPLSLHWLVAPDQPAAYARAVARPRQRREAAAAAERLRDGAFAAAGLDYRSELAPWLGSQSSFALLTSAEAKQPPGWVLALRSRDSAGARRFLQRFWQTRSLAGTDLQISSYRGMGLISGRGALLGQDPQPLATALINDDLVLIASGRGVLEQALDVSQIDELNQAASEPLQQAVARLGQGVALLTARPQAMEQWLGLPASDDAEAIELVAALAPAGAGVSVDAITQLREPLPPLPALPAELPQQLQTPATSLALLSQPAQLLDSEGANAWARLLAPLLQRALAGAAGPLPQLVAAADAGPLLWADQPEGWLLATRPDQPAMEPLQAELEQQGFSLSPLESKGLTVQAWTRLQSRPVKGNPDQLQAQLAGARSQERGWAWWGQGLAVLNQQHEGRQLPQQRLDQLQALGAPTAPLQWAMDGGTAQGLLRRWQPWRLLNTLASTPLTPSVEGAALSLEPDGADRRALRLRASLQLRH